MNKLDIKNSLNIPNFLSILRILLVPLFICFLYQEQILKATAVLLLASVTDMLDGFIARRWRQRTELGSYLDPAADKFLFLSAFVFFTIKGEIPFWFIITIFLRDLVVVSGSFYFRWKNCDFRIVPALAGKWSVGVQVLILAFVLLKRIMPGVEATINLIIPYFIYTSLFLSLYSGVQYVKRGINLYQSFNK